MSPNEKELLQAIHTLDKNTEKRFIKLETKMDDSVTGQFKDIRRRIDTTENNVKVLTEEVAALKTMPYQNKSKWFDEVAKYVLLALVGYLLYKAGLK